MAQFNGTPGAGLRLSVFGQGGPGQAGGYTKQASKGTATWASPQAPQTATQAGFGTVAGGSGATSRVTYGILSAGTISLGLLVWIWWSLPR
jgi:hypothetical protein